MRHAHSHRPRKTAKQAWKEKNTGQVPASVRDALREALKIEKIPDSQFNDFLWIIAQESSGNVDARNNRSTARGLFQLLRAQYELNPQGEKSFGNAIEECQGGIHYVIGRYHSARRAKAFWQQHHWY